MMEWSFKNATTRKDMPRLSENHQLILPDAVTEDNEQPVFKTTQ